MLDFGKGNAGFYWYADSTRGPMLGVSYYTSWQNIDNPIYGTIGDTTPASGSHWSASTTKFTRPGEVVAGADMTAYYTDTTCYANGLSDDITVSN